MRSAGGISVSTAYQCYRGVDRQKIAGMWAGRKEVERRREPYASLNRAPFGAGASIYYVERRFFGREVLHFHRV